jgi:hypothetical protein
MRLKFGFVVVALLLLIPFAAKADDLTIFVVYTDNLRQAGSSLARFAVMLV